jgi:hypothetical protein
VNNAALKLPEITPHTLHRPANDTNGEALFHLPALPLGQGITLAMLEALFPPSDAGCRAIHLRCYSETDLVEEGNKVDTQHILDAVPHIVVSVTRTLTKLSSKQADCVVIDAEILGVIVHETTKLASLHGDFLASKPGRSVRRSALDVVQNETRKAALAERDLVRVGLSQVLGATTDAELAPAQDASSVAAVAQGLAHLADLIDRVLAKGTDDERAARTPSPRRPSRDVAAREGRRAQRGLRGLDRRACAARGHAA